MFKHPLTAAQMEHLAFELKGCIGSKILYCAGESISCFSLVLESQGTLEALLCCFDAPFVRFHLSRLPSKKCSIEKLNHFLEGVTVVSIDLINHDRILKIILSNGVSFVGEFFPRRPNYYFINNKNEILFALHPVASSHYSAPPLPTYTLESAPLLSHQAVDEGYRHLEKEQKKNELRTLVSQTIRKQEKRLKPLEEALRECASYTAVQHEGELLKANFSKLARGMTSLAVWDWELNAEKVLTLDPKKSPQEMLQQRFKRAKKLAAGLSHLETQLAKGKKELLLWQAHLLTIESLETEAAIQDFKLLLFPLEEKAKKEKASAAKALPYHEFSSAAGLKILVGKNAKANDKLTFVYASGSDWWLHIEGYPGSHVVIKTGKNKEPDSETLADAMQLALHFSQAKDKGEGEICITQRKYLSRLGKQLGKVQVSKKKTVRVQEDQERYQEIRKRS